MSVGEKEFQVVETTLSGLKKKIEQMELDHLKVETERHRLQTRLAEVEADINQEVEHRLRALLANNPEPVTCPDCGLPQGPRKCQFCKARLEN